MVCRNICERLYANNKASDGINHYYLVGKKYCRRCETYLFYNKGIFCPCCGMQLRTTPTNRKGKEKLMEYRLKQKGKKDKEP
jgi:uncharacterized Zn finger protein (UPF0148 family)